MENTKDDHSTTLSFQAMLEKISGNDRGGEPEFCPDCGTQISQTEARTVRTINGKVGYCDDCKPDF